MSNQVETYIDIQLDKRDQVSVLFRYILIVPIAIFAAALSAGSMVKLGIGLLTLPVLLSLLVRGIYPSYALRFNHAIIELSTRLTAYALLLNDRYPSIESNDSVRVVFPEVDGGKKLNRFLPLVKWFLAIPLYLVGLVYTLYGLIMLIAAWFATVFTGRMPQVAAEVLFGVTRYWNRVYGYAFVLVTDEYPPFTLNS